VSTKSVFLNFALGSTVVVVVLLCFCCCFVVYIHIACYLPKGITVIKSWKIWWAVMWQAWVSRDIP